MPALNSIACIASVPAHPTAQGRQAEAVSLCVSPLREPARSVPLQEKPNLFSTPANPTDFPANHERVFHGHRFCPNSPRPQDARGWTLTLKLKELPPQPSTHPPLPAPVEDGGDMCFRRRTKGGLSTRGRPARRDAQAARQPEAPGTGRTPGKAVAPLRLRRRAPTTKRLGRLPRLSSTASTPSKNSLTPRHAPR